MIQNYDFTPKSVKDNQTWGKIIYTNLGQAFLKNNLNKTEQNESSQNSNNNTEK